MKVQDKVSTKWPNGQDWPSHERLTGLIMKTPRLSGYGLFPNAASADQLSLTDGSTVDTNPFPYATTIVGLGLTAGMLWMLWPKKGW